MSLQENAICVEAVFWQCENNKQTIRDLETGRLHFQHLKRCIVLHNFFNLSAIPFSLNHTRGNMLFLKLHLNVIILHIIKYQQFDSGVKKTYFSANFTIHLAFLKIQQVAPSQWHFDLLHVLCSTCLYSFCSLLGFPTFSFLPLCSHCLTHSTRTYKSQRTLLLGHDPMLWWKPRWSPSAPLPASNSTPTFGPFRVQPAQEPLYI